MEHGHGPDGALCSDATENLERNIGDPMEDRKTSNATQGVERTEAPKVYEFWEEVPGFVPIREELQETSRFWSEERTRCEQPQSAATDSCEAQRRSPAKDRIVKIFAEDRDARISEILRNDDSEEPDFVPTRDELLHIVKHWRRTVLADDFFRFYSGQISGGDSRKAAFAGNRINSIASLLGDESVDRAYEEAEKEFRAKYDPEFLYVYDHANEQDLDRLQSVFNNFRGGPEYNKFVELIYPDIRARVESEKSSLDRAPEEPPDHELEEDDGDPF